MSELYCILQRDYSGIRYAIKIRIYLPFYSLDGGPLESHLSTVERSRHLLDTGFLSSGSISRTYCPE